MILQIGLAVVQALLPAQTSGHPGTLAPQQAPSPVTITMVTQTKGADMAYQTVIRNTGLAAIATTVTQQLPEGAHDATATNGGGVRGDHIEWTTTVPSGGTVTLRSTATTPRPRPAAFSSVCVVDKSGNALDCASVVAGPMGAPPPPLWRRILLWIAGLLAVGVLVWGVRWLWIHRPKRAPKPPKPPKPKKVLTPEERTRKAILASLAAVVVLPLLLLLITGPIVKSTVSKMTGSLDGGWSGTPAAMSLGAPTSDKTVEFTMYQAGCAKGKGCTVVVAARNTSGEDQQFYRSMQRIYTAADDWVSPDNAATFFQTLPAGTRRLVTLHFPVPANATATRLELREGAFARGVYYDLS